MFLEAASIALTLAMRSCEEKERWFCGQEWGVLVLSPMGEACPPPAEGTAGPKGLEPGPSPHLSDFALHRGYDR